MSSIFVRFPEGRRKAFTLSYDDGHICDERLIKIFDTYGLKGTFNVNYSRFMSRWGDTEDNLKKRVELYKNHEVAVHCLTHPLLSTLSAPAITYEILKDREGLESIFGGIIKGMAYPYYRAGGEKTDNAMRSCGINYGRVTPSSYNFNLPDDWYNWNPTCHHNDPRLMELAENFLSADVQGQSLLFYVWGHSFEFDDQDNWDIMERFAPYISGKEDVWYATNSEIYDYLEAFSRLSYSIDGSLVYNPTAYKIWFTIDNKDYKIEPNQTLKIL